MALTAIQAETILIRRVGILMTAIGLDGTTITGNNPDLVDPMGYAIRYLGGTVTTITDIVDADLAVVTSALENEFFDIAEWRVLLSVQGNYVLVDTKIGPRDEKWGSLADNIDKLVARKEKQIKDTYGLGLQPLQADVISLDFAEHDITNIDASGN